MTLSLCEVHLNITSRMFAGRVMWGVIFTIFGMWGHTADNRSCQISSQLLKGLGLWVTTICFLMVLRATILQCDMQC